MGAHYRTQEFDNPNKAVRPDTRVGYRDESDRIEQVIRIIWTIRHDGARYQHRPAKQDIVVFAGESYVVPYS